MNTVLDQYTIWFDGTITIPSNQIDQYLHIDKLAVDKLTPQLIQFNALMPKTKKLTVKTQCDDLLVAWDIPEYYKTLNIRDIILTKHHSMATQYEWTDVEYQSRVDRILLEYSLYKKCNYIQLLQVMHYLVDTLTSKGVVWGPGRGSSVSSYILYILQVHDVDSVTFELDITDFL